MNIMHEALNEAEDYLPRLISGLSEAARLFREGSDAEGAELFSKAMEGMDWFLYVAEAVHKVMGKAAACSDIEDLSEIIRNLSGAWENGDFVLISDIIDYDLIKNLERWQGTISDIIENEYRNGALQ